MPLRSRETTLLVVVCVTLLLWFGKRHVTTRLDTPGGSEPLQGTRVGTVLQETPSVDFKVELAKSKDWYPSPSPDPLRAKWEMYAGGESEDNEDSTVIERVQIGRPYDQRPYTCWEPKAGLASPVVTIFSENTYENDTMSGFVERNRLDFIVRHKHRFCQITEALEPHRDVQWDRIALVLAILPCSDYIVYMDADAVVMSPEKNFQPWIDMLESEGVDLLLSNDYIDEIPMNLGVFLAKRSAWMYKFFKQVYNVCGCDVEKMLRWPFAQGPVYDMFEVLKDSELDASKHVKVVPHAKWNQQFYFLNASSPTYLEENFVVHYAGCCNIPERNISVYDTNYRFTRIHEDYEKAHGHPMRKIDMDLVEESTDFCLPVRLYDDAIPTYYNNATWVSTQMQFDTDSTGGVNGVNLLTVACDAFMKCTLQKKMESCQDDDKLCGFLAAIGECERIPEYLIGQKGAPGGCVKSCGKCSEIIEGFSE